MWVDIAPAKTIGTASAKVWNITPEPDKDFELRVCILGVKGIEAADWEGTTDAYIRAFFKEN